MSETIETADWRTNFRLWISYRKFNSTKTLLHIKFNLSEQQLFTNISAKLFGSRSMIYCRHRQCVLFQQYLGIAQTELEIIIHLDYDVVCSFSATWCQMVRAVCLNWWQLLHAVVISRFFSRQQDFTGTCSLMMPTRDVPNYRFITDRLVSFIRVVCTNQMYSVQNFINLWMKMVVVSFSSVE